jgi:hypothetical protein
MEGYTDANGNKKTEVEMLMEKVDHDEAEDKCEHSSAVREINKNRDVKIKNE